MISSVKKKISVFPPHSEHGHKQAHRGCGWHHSGPGGDFWRHRVGNRVSIPSWVSTCLSLLLGVWGDAWTLTLPCFVLLVIFCAGVICGVMWTSLCLVIFSCTLEPSLVWNNVGHKTVLGYLFTIKARAQSFLCSPTCTDLNFFLLIGKMILCESFIKAL